MKHRYLLGYLIAAAVITGVGSTRASAQADKDQGTKKYAPPSLPKDHSKPAPRTADGRPHNPDADPSWMGNSVAKWDGDTLVIETIDLTDKSWSGSGKNAGEGSVTFHSDALHVTARMRRPDFVHLTVEITDEDPTV